MVGLEGEGVCDWRTIEGIESWGMLVGVREESWRGVDYLLV